MPHFWGYVGCSQCVGETSQVSCGSFRPLLPCRRAPQLAGQHAWALCRLCPLLAKRCLGRKQQHKLHKHPSAPVWKRYELLLSTSPPSHLKVTISDKLSVISWDNSVKCVRTEAGACLAALPSCCTREVVQSGGRAAKNTGVSCKPMTLATSYPP